MVRRKELRPGGCAITFSPALRGVREVLRVTRTLEALCFKVDEVIVAVQPSSLIFFWCASHRVVRHGGEPLREFELKSPP